MKNLLYFKKKAGILLLSLCAAVGLCAQNPIVVLEAENADSVHAPAKVKSVDGFSGGKYVGGNDPGSYLFFHDVEMDEAGTYEFKTYFNCNGTRRFTVKVNNYPEVECSVKGTAKWDTPPAETTSVLVYMAAGKNNIKITPYPESCKEIDEYKISFMGSSVCYGTGATNNYGYAYMYADLLEQRAQQGIGRDWISSNISIGGNTTQMVLDRWERDLLRDCGRYVFYGLSLGNERNDGAPTQQAAINYEKGMKQLIRQADSVGIVPVMANNYANAGFNADDYEILKNLNLTIQQWTVPSVNMLGAVDDGSGRCRRCPCRTVGRETRGETLCPGWKCSPRRGPVSSALLLAFGHECRGAGRRSRGQDVALQP